MNAKASSTAATEEPGREQVTLVYTGRRIGTRDKIIHVWLMEGRELCYDKLRGSVVGGRYLVEVVAQGDQVSVYPHTLRYSGEKISDSDQVARWQAEDQQARTTAAQKAAERRHAKSTELDEAVEPLRRLVAGARTRAEAQAIAQVVRAKLDEAWWRR